MKKLLILCVVLLTSCASHQSKKHIEAKSVAFLFDVPKGICFVNVERSEENNFRMRLHRDFDLEKQMEGTFIRTLLSLGIDPIAVQNTSALSGVPFTSGDKFVDDELITGFMIKDELMPLLETLREKQGVDILALALLNYSTHGSSIEDKCYGLRVVRKDYFLIEESRLHDVPVMLYSTDTGVKVGTIKVDSLLGDEDKINEDNIYLVKEIHQREFELAIIETFKKMNK